MKTTRPNTVQRRSVAPSDVNPTQWFTFHGYDTYLHELSRIFNINKQTLWMRVRNGWPLEAALVAETRGWNYHTAELLQAMPWVKKHVKATLNAHFKSKKPAK